MVTNKDGVTKTFSDSKEATAYFNKLTGEKIAETSVTELADNTPYVKSYNVYGYTGNKGLIYNTTDGSLKSIAAPYRYEIIPNAPSLYHDGETGKEKVVFEK